MRATIRAWDNIYDQLREIVQEKLTWWITYKHGLKKAIGRKKMKKRDFISGRVSRLRKVSHVIN